MLRQQRNCNELCKVMILRNKYKLQFVNLIGGLIAVYRTKYLYVFKTFDLSFMFHFLL